MTFLHNDALVRDLTTDFLRNNSVIPASLVPLLNPNLLINGAADIWQRGTSFTAATTPANSDDTYLIDGWLFVANGADTVDVSQQTSSPPAGARYFVRSDVQTINQQFGYVLFMEASDAIPLRGQTVSLSLQAKTTAAAISNIRAGILEWTSTADSITSDVVSVWAGGGSNPTLAANWAYANTPANLGLTTSWQNFGNDASITAVTLGSTLNNLAVFVWVDDTTIAANDILDLTMIKLERGNVATDYEPVSHSRIANEEASSGRWCNKFTTLCSDNAWAGGGGPGDARSFPHPMRTTPSLTVTISSGSGATYSALDRFSYYQENNNSADTTATILAEAGL